MNSTEKIMAYPPRQESVYPPLPASSAPVPSAPMWPEEYYHQSWDAHKRQEFDQLCRTYEVTDQMAREARYVLSGQAKVITVDNSGSQGWALAAGKTEIVHSDGHPVVRYDEAKEFLQDCHSIFGH